MTNKRYPLTIPSELDEACKNLVEGDKHFRGSRNQFYIEAIEEKLAKTAGVLGTAAQGKCPPPAERSEPSPIAEQPKPQQHTPQNEEGQGGERTPASSPAPGRKPQLSYYNDSIRNASGAKYRVKCAPKQEDGESNENYFERISTIPGVMFEPVQPDFSDSPLNHPLITGA